MPPTLVAGWVRQYINGIDELAWAASGHIAVQAILAQSHYIGVLAEAGRIISISFSENLFKFISLSKNSDFCYCSNVCSFFFIYPKSEER